MDQKIILRMISSQVQEDGQELSAKLTTQGTLHRDENGATLQYEESSEGLDGQVTIEMRGDTVMLAREGESSMRLLLKQGCKYVSSYETPYGKLDMEAVPTKVNYMMGETNGKVELEYHMTVQNQYVGLNRVTVNYRAK